MNCAQPKAASLAPGWRSVLSREVEKQYFRELQDFVANERRRHTVYPPESEVLTALELTPYESVAVLLLGQDPYYNANQAHGLCFSVRPGIAQPPSLLNIFKELNDDLGCWIPDNGCLVPWARQGVLLLNAVLTVRAGIPNSHRNRGWERFTDAIIDAVNEKPEPVVFVLWGNHAQKKSRRLDTGRHRVVACAHPSPLSAHRGFFGSRSFSRTNNALIEFGRSPIDWQIPNLSARSG